MTETQNTAPVQSPAAPRGVKIALAVSVALNLAVAGLAVGAWLGDGPHKGMPRDMSFGPFSEALDDADRRAIRRAKRRGPNSRRCSPHCAPIRSTRRR